MLRWIVSLMVLAGIGLASCGVGMGGNYAVDCRPRTVIDLPARQVDGMPRPGLARMIANALVLAQPGMLLAPFAAQPVPAYRLAARPVSAVR